jgi:hypothetical protein
MKKSFYEPICGFADDYSAWFGDALQPGGNVRGFADHSYRVRISSIAQVTHDGQTRVNGDANLQRMLWPRAQSRYGCNNFKAGAHCAPRIIFVRYRITEIYEKAVAEKLGYVTAVTPNHVGANPLIATD